MKETTTTILAQPTTSPQKSEESFESFLQEFIPRVASKSKQCNKAHWLLETTGSEDCADLKAELETELRLLFNDQSTYEKLQQWSTESKIKDPIELRQLNILTRNFKENNIPKELMAKIAHQEANLMLSYGNFRPKLKGRKLSENDIRGLLKSEKNIELRKSIWEASKEIGQFLATDILVLVDLRNQAARSVGYSNYFQMQLDLKEVDDAWLFKTLEEVAYGSSKAYDQVLQEIETYQSEFFGVNKEALGAWAWKDPFCQEDPLAFNSLDSLVQEISEVDLCHFGVELFCKMGIDLLPILHQSDMFERSGKNQHAFCINIDRGSDIRTLNNVKPTLKWLETILHEFGHAIYELGFDSSLPWLLRTPPHMIPTEAMALLAGRQAYLPEVISILHANGHDSAKIISEGKRSLHRRQLVFSRWVLVMTYFEKELYRHPKQDLNGLWWSLVEKYQKIQAPKKRDGKNDWAAKVHFSMAPVYYYSYLLGEMFASSLQERMVHESGSSEIFCIKNGLYLQEKLFSPGNKMPWLELAKHAFGHEFNGDAWLKDFAH